MHAVAATSPPVAAAARPALSFWQIWNMCFGFLGIQFGFALQNANVSRIFQTLGASIEQIPLLWNARTPHRSSRAAYRLLLLRPHLEPARPSPAVFSGGRDSRLDRAGADATL